MIEQSILKSLLYRKQIVDTSREISPLALGLIIGALLIIIMIIMLTTKRILVPAEELLDYQVFIINLERKPERYEYVTKQLDALGITNYTRFLAVDGFVNPDFDGVTETLAKRQGLAGCASSHIKLWKHIAENKLGWCLILEDDAHFHPEYNKLFKAYWKYVPKDAKIVYPGYCASPIPFEPVARAGVMCCHGYMLNHIGAKYILDNMLPVNEPIDIALIQFFAHEGSYVFNENYLIEDIKPAEYKIGLGKQANFNGIIYQNQSYLPSTIHRLD